MCPEIIFHGHDGDAPAAAAAAAQILLADFLRQAS